MDQVVQEILKRYRDYKKKLRESLGRPMPTPLMLLLVLILPIPAFSADLILNKLVPYYGQDFYDRTARGERDAALISDLYFILSRSHVRQRDDMDEISEQVCDAANKSCYYHAPVGYKTARKVVMGNLHYDETTQSVEDVYCQRDLDKGDFPTGPFPGPGSIPNDRVINVEHTWPQSRFNSKMSTNAQKSDLHHLFPTDSEMNRIRGNMRFGEVDAPAKKLRCPESKMGSVNGQSGDFFEPPNKHKGNVARALFYFSVRYQLPISSVEEAFLRKWHLQDPVDAEEVARNDQVYKIQGNRNPFIDFPELVDSISKF